jgi:phosphomannomutase/phosphoglucomutase
MNQHVFRSYDIRGIYPKEINEEFALKIGKAFGTFNPGRIVVGRDCRLSSPSLKEKVIEGLTSTGCEVIDIGAVHTPVVIFSVAYYGFDGGIQITASVDSEEYTLVENIKTKERKLVKIGDFIKTTKNGSFKNFKVLAFNPSSSKVSFQKIKNVYEHDVNELLFELILENGRRVKVTESHSVFVLREGKIISIPTKELKIGDLIPAVNFIPNNSIVPKINLLKGLWPFRNELRKIILTGKEIIKINLKRSQQLKKKRIKLKKSGRKLLIKKRKEMGVTRKEASKRCCLSVATIQRIELGKNRDFVKESSLVKYLDFLGINANEFIRKFSSQIRYFNQMLKDGHTFNYLDIKELQPAELGKINKCYLHGYGYPKNSIPNSIKISPLFMRLLGYYLAEGNLECKDRVCFNLGRLERGHERMIAKEIIECSKRLFNLTPKVYIYPTKTKIAVDNVIVYALFSKILKFENKKASTKSLPDFVYNLPKNFIIELLRALFLGDGSVIRRKGIKFSSVSRELAVGLTYLFSMMGINYIFNEREDRRKNRKKIFEIIILDTNELKKLSRVWKDHYLAWTISNKEVKKKSESKLREGNLIFLRLREIKKVEPTSDKVYDFCVDSGTFIAGAGGICCHNSHNPKEWNGFLFYGKSGIPTSYEKGINKIKDLFFSEKFKTGKGRVVAKDVINDYKKFLLEKIKLKTPVKLKVVIDAGNGVVGPIILPIFKSLGINVVDLFCEPDGNFPNREPEPTKENLGELVKKVKEVKADLGLAFDGDGDRLVAVDEKGNLLTPTQLFGVLIKAYLKGKKEKVVHDALTSKAIDELIEYYRGLPIGCRVGHVYIQEKLLKENAILGGEISGHYFFREIFGADDAVFASLKLIEYLVNSGKKLSECYVGIPQYFFDTLRVKTLDEKKFEFIEKLKEEFKIAGYKIDTLDGVKVIFPYGWALFRPSHTEPKISIAYEAKNEKDFEKIKDFVNKIIEKIPK